MRLGSYLGNYSVLNIRLRMEIFLVKSSSNYSRLYAFVCPSVLVSLGKCRRRFWVVMEGNLALCHRSMVQQRGAVGFATGMALYIVTPLAFYPHSQNRTRPISWEHNPMPATVYLCDLRIGGTPEAQNFILGIISNECICDTN